LRASLDDATLGGLLALQGSGVAGVLLLRRRRRGRRRRGLRREAAGAGGLEVGAVGVGRQAELALASGIGRVLDTLELAGGLLAVGTC